MNREFVLQKKYDMTTRFRMDYIRFYHLRSYDRINAPLSWFFQSRSHHNLDYQYPESYIEKAERFSGIKFSQAQIALSRKWINGDTLTTQRTVKIKTLEETTEGLVPTSKTDKLVQEFPIPVSEEEADETIRRFEEGAKSVRGDENVSDNVSQHMLHDNTSLWDEQWLGTAEEELDSCVF